MSSALMASTTPEALRLTLMALARLARKPVTTTSSTSED
jgi:ribosomal protein L30E